MNRSTPEIVESMFPIVVAAGAASMDTNIFHLPAKSWELDRYRYQAALPFSLYLCTLIDESAMESSWKKDVKRKVFDFPGDFACELIDHVSLSDLCPSQGDRDDFNEHIRIASKGLYKVEFLKEYPIKMMIRELAMARYPRFAHDYKAGRDLAATRDLNHLASSAFWGVSRNYLFQLSANPEHHNAERVAQFAIKFAGAARMIHDTFYENYA